MRNFLTKALVYLETATTISTIVVQAGKKVMSLFEEE